MLRAMTTAPNLSRLPNSPIDPPEPSLQPAQMISRAEAMRPVLRERQAMCEQLGRMPEETNDEFVRAGFYRILQPRCFGGYEFDLTTFVRVMIEVSRGCVESGWTLALTAGHPAAFLAAFSEQGQREVYGDDGECRAPGVAVPGGFAVPVEGGYRIKGAWDYCSGADIGTHFLGGMMALGQDTKVPRAYVYVLIDRKDYQIVDNWNVFGMQGTGSRRVIVDDMFVPAHRVMETGVIVGDQLQPIRNQPGRAMHPNPLYHGQPLPLLMFELVSVVIGAARGALDVYEQIVREKTTKVPPFTPLFQTADSQRRFGDAQGFIDTAEAALLKSTTDYTEACRLEKIEGVAFSDEAGRRMHRVQEQCLELSWQATDLMFRTGGTASAAKSALLGRYYRNLAVIRTHIIVQPDHTSTNVGRLHFGLPPLSTF
jgi:3-hydroxy-9,10-secoandrosta-1,3,5(10)-triene-9,17-dione monooxygenase